ncbi:hypothetical protein CEXT_29341 [Caerostris extrusa]|uniref:Uncharacterized protein n=1 Tax=Caerostris extrusa TaxID=172846 RepID=A0AAV4XIU0_CAEEX|nr:hypothetical protein CEXT_29341 [Caerostris extrusa]
MNTKKKKKEKSIVIASLLPLLFFLTSTDISDMRRGMASENFPGERLLHFLRRFQGKTFLVYFASRWHRLGGEMNSPFKGGNAVKKFENYL